MSKTLPPQKKTKKTRNSVFVHYKNKVFVKYWRHSTFQPVIMSLKQFFFSSSGLNEKIVPVETICNKPQLIMLLTFGCDNSGVFAAVKGFKQYCLYKQVNERGLGFEWLHENILLCSKANLDSDTRLNSFMEGVKSGVFLTCY